MADVKKSLDEVLAISDPAPFVDAGIAFVNDQQIAHSFESLTATEKVVLLANDCSYRLIRGGLTDPLLNPGLEWRNAMLSALSEIGATDAEGILRAGADLFDAVPEQAGTYGDVIALAGEDKIDALSREFDRCDAQVEIDRRLFEYIVRHRERFRSE
jgi:hypothetical protein